MRLCLLALICALALPIPGPSAAQERSLEEIAKSVLKDLQPKSIRRSREYCGLIGRNRNGRFVTGPISGGTRSFCKSVKLPGGVKLVASFHTHGAYHKAFDNEVPSHLDLETEMELGILGYVATPGGRFWVVDGHRGEVRLICGPGCLPWDPRYKDGKWGKIARRYSLDDLHRRARKDRFDVPLCNGVLCVE